MSLSEVGDLDLLVVYGAILHEDADDGHPQREIHRSGARRPADLGEAESVHGQHEQEQEVVSRSIEDEYAVHRVLCDVSLHLLSRLRGVEGHGRDLSLPAHLHGATRYPCIIADNREQAVARQQELDEGGNIEIDCVHGVPS